MSAPSVSVKLLSHRCGVFSRRALLDSSSSFSDLLAQLSLPPSSPLLYRETPHRCSELVLLASDGDWEAAKARAGKQGGELVVLSQVDYEQRRERLKRRQGVALCVVLCLLAALWGCSLFPAMSAAAFALFFWGVGILFGLAAKGKCSVRVVGSVQALAGCMLPKCTRTVDNSNTACNAGECKGPAEAKVQDRVPAVASVAPVAPAVAVEHKEQLQTLFSLGFTDVRRNAELLQRCGGDINVAVQSLLNDK